MASGKGVKPYDPLKVEKTDHPDLVGGVIWADCELEWIRAYGTRCYNHGNAKGMEAGRLLFEEPKVGCDGTAVTREMITAAHGVTLKTGDVVLSARLLESIYLAMDAVRHKEYKERWLPIVQGELERRAVAFGWRSAAPEGGE